MTKCIKCCLMIMVVIFIVSLIVILTMYRKKSNSDKIAIIRDNQILYEFDLSKINDTNIKIEYTQHGGYNIIKIKDGEISIADADCPDKTCVKTGVLHSADIPIICIPHHLVIRYTNK